MIGNDFDTPIMYQDLANYTMGPMSMPFGTAVMPYNRSLLNGTTMQRQLDNDKVEIMNKKNQQDKSIFKKAVLGIGLVLAAGFIPFICKGIKNGNLWQSVKDLFKSAPKKSKQPFMSRIKGWFSSGKEKAQGLYESSKNKFKNSTPKIKNWFSRKWEWMKNLVKFKK